MNGWHEPASVSITRLVCQLVLSIVVFGVGLFLVLTRPEYNAGVALAIGVVMGAWFGVLREPRLAQRRNGD